jgi:hypothetical protein
MLLSDLFNQLAYGPLSMLNIASTGKIQPEDYPKMGSCLNTAINTMFVRLKLCTEEEVVIQLYDHITVYTIDKQFAVNGGTDEPYKYLIDTAMEPYNNTLVKITGVYDEDGVELVLNDLSVADSVMTPRYNQIQVEEPVSTNSLAVTYLAKPATLNITPTTDLTSIELDVPDYLVLPLGYFIASLLISPIGQEGLGEGNNYLAKYEAALMDITNNGLFVMDATRADQFANNGWV